jgi:hypothetical protein
VNDRVVHDVLAYDEFLHKDADLYGQFMGRLFYVYVFSRPMMGSGGGNSGAGSASRGNGWDRVHGSVVRNGGRVLWTMPGCTLQGVEARLDLLRGASRVPSKRKP